MRCGARGGAACRCCGAGGGKRGGLAAGCWASAPRPWRKGRRRKKKKATYPVPTYLPFLGFFEIFRSDLKKYFYGVFGLLMQRNGQKCDKKNRWEKTKGKKFFSLNFFGQKFLTCTFPQKVFYGVFELPLLRNAQKRWVKTKGKKKISTFSAKSF